METQLIKIVPDPEKRTWIERVRGTAKGGVISTSAAKAYDWWSGSSEIAEVPRTAAKKFRDHNGDRLQVGRVYARHPFSGRSMVAYRAESFHDFIVAEQIYHITRYFRSAVALRKLRIDVISESRAEAGAEVGVPHISRRLKGL